MPFFELSIGDICSKLFPATLQFPLERTMQKHAPNCFVPRNQSRSNASGFDEENVFSHYDSDLWRKIETENHEMMKS
jgi:hypothetical protein